MGNFNLDKICQQTPGYEPGQTKKLGNVPQRQPMPQGGFQRPQRPPGIQRPGTQGPQPMSMQGPQPMSMQNPQASGIQRNPMPQNYMQQASMMNRNMAPTATPAQNMASALRAPRQNRPAVYNYTRGA